MEQIKSLPRCYSLSFDIETVTLFLKIQKWIIPKLQEYFLKQINMMEYMYKTYGGDQKLFDDFGKEGKFFGWADSIIWNKETKDEIIYSYTFTPVEEPTDEICEKCNGTKIDSIGRDCYECHRTGKKHIFSKHHFSDALISLCSVVRLANMALLESCIEDKEKRNFFPQTDKKQLIAVEWSDTTGMCNCWISAWVDDSVLEWVKNAPNSDAKFITDAMQKTEEVLLSRKMDTYDFRFWYNTEDLFGFQVPGNACTLSTCKYGMGMFGNVGKTLSPHNVDHRFQQADFIVGLAVLNDLVEKSIN